MWFVSNYEGTWIILQDVASMLWVSNDSLYFLCCSITADQRCSFSSFLLRKSFKFLLHTTIHSMPVILKAGWMKRTRVSWRDDIIYFAISLEHELNLPDARTILRVCTSSKITILLCTTYLQTDSSSVRVDRSFAKNQSIKISSIEVESPPLDLLDVAFKERRSVIFLEEVTDER